jgi:acetate kinase
MSVYILALNCGSSSLKFNIFSIEPGNRLKPYIQGIVEEIGNLDRSMLKYTVASEKNEKLQSIGSHKDALMLIFKEMGEYGINPGNIASVGHRVAHGGNRYVKSVLIDKDVISAIRRLIPLAPLHNSPNLTGIEEASRLLPNVPQVAVFDTAFHASIPPYAFRYAVPEEWFSAYGVRRYGFHGTSHLYVSRRAAKYLGVPYDKFNCITVHLGNGCSVSKINNGKSIGTSMGFTPLQGLVMGTRSGDIDPALISHVANSLTREKNLTELDAYKSVFQALNRDSGLKALAGTSIMQDLRQRALEGDSVAEEAISIYAYRVAEYIGAYWATLPGVHAIVFTAGIGENEGYVRKKILSYLENLNIELDEMKNSLRKCETVIAMGNVNCTYPIKVMVIPTDEESVIGYDAMYLGHLKQDIPEKYPFELE